MGLWLRRNIRNIIIVSFILPILLVAIVSINHVTTMYGLTNPLSWSVYLSVGVEVAALAALAAISVRMGKFVYFPFIIVTIIQLLGNMYSTYLFIDETSKSFKEWVNFIGPIIDVMGIDKADISSQKRILSFFTGGLLPFISLTFAHMLVVFSDRNINEIPAKNIAVTEPENFTEVTEESNSEISDKQMEDMDNKDLNDATKNKRMVTYTK